MAALNTDLLKKLSRRWVGQIGSGGVSDAIGTTIPLASATNLATTTAVLVTIDRVNANGVATPTLEESVIGVVSGDNLTGCVRGAEGTAQAHAAGAVVEILVTAKGVNDIIDHLLVQHTQLGVHTSALVTSLKATGSVIDTGTSDVTIVTPKAITDASVLVKLAGAQTLTGKKTLAAVVQTVTALSPAGAGTSTCDLALGNIFTLTMPADTQTLAVSNEVAGQCFLVEINNVTSQGTLTWFTTIKWAGGSAPTLTGTNGKRDVFGFRVTGTDTYDGFIVGQNL